MRTNGSPELLEQRRQIAARMFRRGDASESIAEVLAVDPQTVRAWRREFDAGGLDALLAKPHPGPKCKLTDEQKQHLLTLLEQPPSAYGFDAYLWTTKRITRLILDRFGVEYHHDHVGVILHQLGYSYQKPALRPRERDEQAIEGWRTETWPAIAKRSRERNATIVFVDEAGFRMTPSVKKQWARRADTPVLDHRCRHHRKVNVIGGLAIRPQRNALPSAYLAWHADSHVDQAKASAFLKQLIRQIPGPLTVIWDNLGAHHGPKIRGVLSDHPLLELHYLPPYAPELNPIEGLWCLSKHHRLANYCPRELGELVQTAKATTTDVGNNADLLMACICETRLDDALYPPSPQ